MGLSLLFIVDVAFLLANLTKLEEGGWLPLASGLIILLADADVAEGARLGHGAPVARTEAGARFRRGIEARSPVRVAGTAIFLDAKASGIPRALLNNIKFNRVMHERVVLLTVSPANSREWLHQALDRNPGYARESFGWWRRIGFMGNRSSGDLERG